MNVIKFLGLEKQVIGVNWENRLTKLVLTIYREFGLKDEIGLNRLRDTVDRAWERLLSNETAEIRIKIQKFGTIIKDKLLNKWDKGLITVKYSAYFNKELDEFVNLQVAKLNSKGFESVRFIEDKDLNKTTGFAEETMIKGSSKLPKTDVEEINNIRKADMEHYINSGMESKVPLLDTENPELSLSICSMAQGSEMVELDTAALQDDSYMELVKQDVLNSKSLYVDADNWQDVTVGKDRLPEEYAERNQTKLFDTYKNKLKLITSIYGID